MTTNKTVSTKRPIPRKLDDAMINTICTAISKGAYPMTACALSGIDYSTFRNWLKQADDDFNNNIDSIYTDLVLSVKRAEAIAEEELIKVVREAATIKREWLPAITFLERRHPDRWGRKDRTQVDITENKTITVNHVEVRIPGGEQRAIEGEYREVKELGEGTDTE